MDINDVFETLRIAVGEKLDANKKVALAIDGCAASGKTTLGEMLSDYFDAPVVHTDDFFLRPFQRTGERYATPGGNIDYERFSSEVLPHIFAHDAFEYRKFDCGKMALGDSVRIHENDLIIVEGTYACHEKFIDSYNIKAMLTINEKEQRRRILLRSGAARLADFEEKWIPLEKEYFSRCSVADKCDFVFSV